jgi:hypothetical protein
MMRGMPDTVTVVVSVGEPNAPAVSVMRSQTVVTASGADMEGVAIEALRLVDALCGEAREEALRQTRVVMDNVIGQQRAVGG